MKQDNYVMKHGLVNAYMFSAGALLLVTSIAKLLSVSGHMHILQYPDPIFGIKYGLLFGIVGFIELFVGIGCFYGRLGVWRTRLLAWLATNIFGYRIGLSWVHYNKPCKCLGNLTDVLHVQPETADMIMKIVLAYLLVGSYYILIRCWSIERMRKSS